MTALEWTFPSDDHRTALVRSVATLHGVDVAKASARSLLTTTEGEPLHGDLVPMSGEPLSDHEADERAGFHYPSGRP